MFVFLFWKVFPKANIGRFLKMPFCKCKNLRTDSEVCQMSLLICSCYTFGSTRVIICPWIKLPFYSSQVRLECELFLLVYSCNFVLFLMYDHLFGVVMTENLFMASLCPHLCHTLWNQCKWPLCHIRLQPSQIIPDVIIRGHEGVLHAEI